MAIVMLYHSWEQQHLRFHFKLLWKTSHSFWCFHDTYSFLFLSFIINPIHLFIQLELLNHQNVLNKILYIFEVGGPLRQIKAADYKFSSLTPPHCPSCLHSHHPKLTGLAQLQLNKKGIASVKTQFTNMTSPLVWLEIWNIDLCAVKGLIKMITYTWGINAQKINRNFILDTRLSPMVKC